jgi:hypothetical protein
MRGASSGKEEETTSMLEGDRMGVGPTENRKTQNDI